MARNIPGLDRYLRRLAAIPAAVKRAAQAQLEANAAELVEAQKRQVPVDEGDLRDAHRWERGQTPLKVVVINDAKDEEGRPKALPVEFGHIAADGTRVAPQPWFFPVYRSRKKAMKRKMGAATRKAAKEAFDRG